MSKLAFTPTPGYIVINPISVDKKSDYVSVVDTQDQPHKGTVLAVGDSYVDDKGNEKKSPVNVGDFVLYSIMGIEEFKMEYDGDVRHRLIIAPFGRILGVIK